MKVHKSNGPLRRGDGVGIVALALLGTVLARAPEQTKFAEVFPLEDGDYYVTTPGSRDTLTIKAKRQDTEESHYMLMEVSNTNRTKDIQEVMPMLKQTLWFTLEINVYGKWHEIPFADPWEGRIFRRLTKENLIELFPGESITKRIARRVPSQYARFPMRVKVTHSINYYGDDEDSELTYERESRWCELPPARLRE